MKKVKQFHTSVQFSALVKLFVSLVAAVLSGGLVVVGRGGEDKRRQRRSSVT